MLTVKHNNFELKHLMVKLNRSVSDVVYIKLIKTTPFDYIQFFKQRPKNL